jgi:hypothetical protein
MLEEIKMTQYDASIELDALVSKLYVDCPKCLSPNARYVVDSQDVTLRCLCGFHKVVATRLEQMVIEHPDTGKDVKLPRRDTKLWICLIELYVLGGEATTQEIAEALNSKESERQTMSEVASQLTVLRYKGLVTPLENRKGIVGGSKWGLTQPASTMLRSV